MQDNPVRPNQRQTYREEQKFTFATTDELGISVGSDSLFLLETIWQEIGTQFPKVLIRES